MASSDATASGGATSAKTPAQLMQEQHEAAEAHRPTVEDVVDEDDIEHPPPALPAAKEEGPAPVPTNGLMSTKAAGKQKATEKLGVIDTQDEEAFPSLGPAPKPTAAPTSRLSGWAASASKAPKTNGAASTTSRPASSGVPTPSSTPGMMTPTSTATGHRAGVALPGRYTDSFEIGNAELDKSKTVRKVLDDVKKKYNVLVTTKSTNFGNSIAFTAEGPKARVTEALMYISKELTVETQVKLEIPSSVSAQIIGRAGANIKKLESQFNVRIRIDRDRREATGTDDMRTDAVEIRGHAAQVRQVEAQISSQARSLQPKVDVPLRNIPPEFYPFLAGRHGQRVQKMQDEHDLQIQIPDYYTWQQRPPPRAGEASQGPRFVPHGDSHIVVSGDQTKARQVQRELERLAEQLEHELALEELACEQILHPYIVGDRGMDPMKFMAQTGCAIVVPPAHQDTEDIHIIGPKDRLDHGRSLAEELMSKKYNRAVDLNKHYQDAPQGAERHSRALAQYLQRKAIQREFQKSHSAEIVFPTSISASPSWNIITDDSQKALSARNELSKITQAYPTPRLRLVEVDPFFHPHIEQLHADKMQDTGVHMIVPDNGEDLVVLVYEGPTSDSPFTIPRTRPTQSEVTEFEKALQEAEALLLGSLPHQGISADDFTVPRKFHDKVRRFVNNEPKPQPPQSFPVQVEFGGHRGPKTQAAARGSPDRVFLRGPDEADIADLRKKIEQFLIGAEEDEKERGYITTFDFPQKYNKNLIGRQGAHINQLRDKHDVQIDTKDTGKVKIQGPQKKAEACKAEILRLLKGWEDEVNYVIIVDPKYHGMLVGRNGENLQKIQSKVNNEVRIDFPRVSRVADDASIADSASDVGGKGSQPSDEIRIRGPKAKAEKVKDELLTLKQYLEDNSHTATVSVAQAQIPSLLGKKGSEMEKLRTDTGAQIDVPKGGDSERVIIQIKGTKQQVDKAKAELQSRSKTFDDIVTRTLEVDRKHHRAIIGGGGERDPITHRYTFANHDVGANIRSIVNMAGGADLGSQAVQFPRQGEESNTLTIRGPKSVTDKIVAAIESHVKERDSQVSDMIDVPTNQHRSLIGSGGNIRKKMEEDFGVSINVPKQGSGQTGVKITGLSENVAKCKDHIGSLISRQEGETIMIPRNLHNVVARNGATFGELNRMGVRVDHNGQKPPSRPAPSGRKANGDMPLITDQAGEQEHSWEIVGGEDGETGEIPWVLSAQKSAKEDSLQKAKAKIQQLLESNAEPPVTGYLILSDPRLHRRIIGKGGATINGIRESSGADIQVPKNNGRGEEGEAIVITGTEEGVVNARDLIFDALRNAGGSD